MQIVPPRCGIPGISQSALRGLFIRLAWF